MFGHNTPITLTVFTQEIDIQSNVRLHYQLLLFLVITQNCLLG